MTERKKRLIAKQVAERLIGVEPYPVGTIVYAASCKQYGVVCTVDHSRHHQPYYLVRCENGDLIQFTRHGIENNYVSRTQYKKDIRRRRKAGLKVNSLI